MQLELSDPPLFGRFLTNRYYKLRWRKYISANQIARSTNLTNRRTTGTIPPFSLKRDTCFIAWIRLYELTACAKNCKCWNLLSHARIFQPTFSDSISPRVMLRFNYAREDRFTKVQGHRCDDIIFWAGAESVQFSALASIHRSSHFRRETWLWCI